MGFLVLLQPAGSLLAGGPIPRAQRGGVPPKVVQERLGHSKVAMTMDVYAHVLPTMQADAAALLGGLLHGR